ncbi:MAG TPA: four helix bundle protein [Chthonomonadaceae bacterium]|nr:four helix bundle protein [Chthonomonadaceae bacterium]
MRLQSYRELRVWQNGMRIAELCYHLTRDFPREELYSMTSQIRRAASAIPANIAEGYGRGHRTEYVQFVRVANGSLKELETHLLLSIRVQLAEEAEVEAILALCEEEGRMLTALLQSLSQTE